MTSFNKLKIYINYRIERIKNYIYLTIKLQIELLQYIVNKPKKINKFPTTIQLPITYKCNFDCVMCGMRNLLTNEEFSAKELGEILSDKLYSKVDSIGINGGEPFLKKDLIECLGEIIDKIPTVRSFHIISNGFFTERICEQLKVIRKISKERNIKVNLALSVDGVEDMQDFMRGTSKAWENVNNTIDRLLEELEIYCDSLKIICTVTKHNVFRLYEVEKWAEQRKLNVSYNIATVNVRIDNKEKVEDFSIFSNEEARMFAAEFFYKRFLINHSQREFAIYMFIVSGNRYAECDCQYNKWVTLTPNKQLGYCATHSKNLGDALEKSSYEIFNDNVKYLKELRKEHCKTCSHYIYRLNKSGLKKYYNELKRIDRC